MANYEIRFNGPEDNPYGPILESMVASTFPGSTPNNKTAIFEAVVAELIGTKQHRYGPTPDPESLVAIREAVRESIRQNLPIPILIPWGASKQGAHQVDIAELMALRQLDCLNSRIHTHYSPGIEIIIRLEDLTDNHLFEEVPGWAEKTKKYVATFSHLHSLMANAFSIVRPESQLMIPKEFQELARYNAQFLLQAMRLTNPARGNYLVTNIDGWVGDLPDVQLDFYRKAYDKFYPGETSKQKDTRLSMYFGGAIARFQLRGTGASHWNRPYITLSFTGIPWGKAGRRIYYRTIPERFTNQHRAPWIGKGYVRIRGREATPAIAGFDGDGLNYVPAYLTIFGQSTASPISIQSDYVVMD